MIVKNKFEEIFKYNSYLLDEPEVKELLLYTIKLKKALLISGRLATSASKVIHSDLVSLSNNINELDEKLNDYNNYIISMVDNSDSNL